MNRLLREPLFQFLVGGAALFVLYAVVSGPQAEPRDRIVVTEERVAMLTQGFERTWLRPPTEAELDGVIDDFVVEEMLYREALALGLDRDDLVVRRRLRQKMEFLNEGLSETEPLDEELGAFLDEHPERFLVPERVGFLQVFVGADGEGSPEERAAAMLARLRAGEDAEDLGDPTLLPGRLEAVTLPKVAGTFGPAFAEALAGTPEGEWLGPLPSSFGLHLVRVTSRTPERRPSLEEARDAVVREWAADRHQQARTAFYDALRARYDVEVRVPHPVAAPETAARP